MTAHRYLAGAHLDPTTDSDILPWAQELARTGRLSQAVKDGLRLVQYLCRLPQGEDYLRRGILTEAVKAGLLQITGNPREPVPAAHRGEREPDQHCRVRPLDERRSVTGETARTQAVGNPEVSLDQILGT